MAQVSLIVIHPPDPHAHSSTIDGWRDGLTAAGHAVEIVVVGRNPDSVGGDGVVHVDARHEGLTGQAVAGLRAATGEVLVVIAGHRRYDPAELPRVVEPLIEGRGDVAVADGRQGGWRAVAAALLKPLCGSSDPFAGLVAITAETFRRSDAAFRPVGRRFTLEILARTKDRRVIDVPMEIERSYGFPVLTLNDVRHIKRILDDKYGNISRLFQFCFVGASGMVIDLSCYAAFQWLLGRTPIAGRPASLFGLELGTLDMVTARMLAMGVALTWNFTLNRYLTFNYAKKGSLVRKFITYVLSNALGVALSLAISLALPRSLVFFARHKLAAAFVGIVAATGINFSMARWFVFREIPSRPPVDAVEAALTPGRPQPGPEPAAAEGSA